MGYLGLYIARRRSRIDVSRAYGPLRHDHPSTGRGVRRVPLSRHAQPDRRDAKAEIIKIDDFAHSLIIHFVKTDNLPPPKGNYDKPHEDIQEAFDAIPLCYDDNGSPYAQAFLTPDFFKGRHMVRLPPSTVIPVVFVPGIMGTNLKVSLSELV